MAIRDEDADPGLDPPAVGDDLLARVLGEIAAEVDRRRRAGDLPAGLEEEMDAVFLRFVPGPVDAPGAAREALALLDSISYDEQVPLGSRLPAGGAVKQGVERLVGWYVRYHTAQLAQSQRSLTRAVHLLAEELAGLEPRLGPSGLGAAGGRLPAPPEATAIAAEELGALLERAGDRWWTPLAVQALGAAPAGRVLHASAGRGELVAALIAAGISAYGIEPDAGLLAAARAAGADVRRGEAAVHLQGVGPGTLAGLVLEGEHQWCTPGTRAELVDLAASRLKPGGVLLVASFTPEAWARRVPPVVLDLAPGRPLHAETWPHLLDAFGLHGAAVHRGGEDHRVGSGGALPSRTDEVLEALVARVDELLGGPDEYVVVAQRPA